MTLSSTSNFTSLRSSTSDCHMLSRFVSRIAHTRSHGRTPDDPLEQESRRAVRLDVKRSRGPLLLRELHSLLSGQLDFTTTSTSFHSPPRHGPVRPCIRDGGGGRHNRNDCFGRHGGIFEAIRENSDCEQCWNRRRLHHGGAALQHSDHGHNVV
jgi:hypothetical protein